MLRKTSKSKSKESEKDKTNIVSRHATQIASAAQTSMVNLPKESIA